MCSCAPVRAHSWALPGRWAISQQPPFRRRSTKRSGTGRHWRKLQATRARPPRDSATHLGLRSRYMAIRGRAGEFRSALSMAGLAMLCAIRFPSGTKGYQSFPRQRADKPLPTNTERHSRAPRNRRNTPHTTTATPPHHRDGGGAPTFVNPIETIQCPANKPKSSRRPY